MKICTECGETKDEPEFSFKKKPVRQTKCKVCVRAYNQTHYQRDPSQYIVRKAKLRIKYRDRVAQIKASPCMDCDQSFHFSAMDFDHPEGCEKLNNVSAMIGSGWSWSRIQAEIAKCDLVCSNCHRVRTFQRRNSSSG